jgi:copper chaperone NosL
MAPRSFAALILLAALLTPPGPARPQDAQAPQAPDVRQHPSCGYCGMDRGRFGHTRMLITYEDGSSAGVCSLHCAAVELAANLSKVPRTIQVGDAASRKLIDAEKAAWVVGGARPGVMTIRGKWAFESRDAAQAFARENGGDLATFEEALQAAYQDLYADLQMLRGKRKAAKAGDGEHAGHHH